MDNYSENEAPKEGEPAAAPAEREKEANAGAILQEICSLVPAFSYHGGEFDELRELRFTTGEYTTTRQDLIKAFSLVKQLPESYKFFFAPLTKTAAACPICDTTPETCLHNRAGLCKILSTAAGAAACPYMSWKLPTPRAAAVPAFSFWPQTKNAKGVFELFEDPKFKFPKTDAAGKTTYTYMRKSNVAKPGAPPVYVKEIIKDCTQELTSFHGLIIFAVCSIQRAGYTSCTDIDILQSYHHQTQDVRKATKLHPPAHYRQIMEAMALLRSTDVVIDASEQAKKQKYKGFKQAAGAGIFTDRIIPCSSFTYKDKQGETHCKYDFQGPPPLLAHCECVKQFKVIDNHKFSQIGIGGNRSLERSGLETIIHNTYIIPASRAPKLTKTINIQNLMEIAGELRRIDAGAAAREAEGGSQAAKAYRKSMKQTFRQRVERVLKDATTNGHIKSYRVKKDSKGIPIGYEFELPASAAAPAGAGDSEPGQVLETQSPPRTKKG